MNINDIALTSIETITAFDTSGNYLFTMDELQNVTVAQSQESTEITGKGGRKLATLKKNKAVTISGSNGLVSGGLMEIQTGGNFTNKATQVLWTDDLFVDATHKATTSYIATGTAGSEIEALYVKNSNGTLGEKLTQAATAAAGKFAYDPATKALTFHTDIAKDTEVVVYYKRNITANVLENKSDKYSGKATLYIDAMAEDKCNNVYHVQLLIYKADFSGEFSLEIGDNQTVHSFEAESLAGGCGANSNGNLWTYTIFGTNEGDYSALSSIAITTAPTKTTYTAGEAFNATGMVVTATYADGDTAAVTGYTFAPTGALTTSDTSVTVTYTENGTTKTATQAITVNAN